jgi:hypothetical protein
MAQLREFKTWTPKIPMARLCFEILISYSQNKF